MQQNGFWVACATEASETHIDDITLASTTPKSLLVLRFPHVQLDPLIAAPFVLLADLDRITTTSSPYQTLGRTGAGASIDIV